VLIADGASQHGSPPAALRRLHGLTADHRVLDVFKDFSIGFALVMVRIDVDDQEILIIARACLLGSMLEMLRGVVIVGRELAYFAAGHVHGKTPLSGNDVKVFAALHDIKALELEAAVADAFTGFQVVFVAVPGADEMNLIGKGLSLIGAVARYDIDN